MRDEKQAVVTPSTLSETNHTTYLITSIRTLSRRKTGNRARLIRNSADVRKFKPVRKLGAATGSSRRRSRAGISRRRRSEAKKVVRESGRGREEKKEETARRDRGMAKAQRKMRLWRKRIKLTWSLDLGELEELNCCASEGEDLFSRGAAVARIAKGEEAC